MNTTEPKVNRTTEFANWLIAEVGADPEKAPCLTCFSCVLGLEHLHKDAPPNFVEKYIGIASEYGVKAKLGESNPHIIRFFEDRVVTKLAELGIPFQKLGWWDTRHNRLNLDRCVQGDCLLFAIELITGETAEVPRPLRQAIDARYASRRRDEGVRLLRELADRIEKYDINQGVYPELNVFFKDTLPKFLIAKG